MITVIVQAGFGSTMLDGSPSWATLGKVRGGETNRGRPSVDQRFEAGTGFALLDDRSGDLTPTNVSGTYYPNVKIGVPVRILAQLDGESTTIPLFYGSARSWRTEYPQGNHDARSRVTLADGFYTLNHLDLAGQSYPKQRTDQRITAVLDDVGWPAGMRDLDTGVATVQATSFASPGDGGDHSALAHLLDVAEAEAGVLFMGADGAVVFRNRVAQASASPVATYDGEDDYSEIDPKPDDAVLYNVIRIARKKGAQVEYIDAASVDSHDPRVMTKDSMPMGSDSEVLSVAQWLAILFAQERQRIDGLVFKPIKDETLAGQLLNLELRDVLTVQHDPPGPGSTLDALSAVEMIRHEFPPKDFTTTLSVVPLTDAEQGPFFQLDVSALDSDAALA